MFPKCSGEFISNDLKQPNTQNFPIVHWCTGGVVQLMGH